MSNSYEYLTIGKHYLNLAGAACNELVSNNNAHFVTSASRPVSVDEYVEKTKWSDHSIGIAVLFNFFHGIEAILKGFIAISNDVPKHHKLSELLNVFEASFPGTAVGNIIRQNTLDIDHTSPLGNFFSTNGITVDTWYQALKYPESTKGQSYSHTNLKYGGINTIDFWETVGHATIQLVKESVALSRSIETPTTGPT